MKGWAILKKITVLLLLSVLLILNVGCSKNTSDTSEPSDINVESEPEVSNTEPLPPVERTVSFSFSKDYRGEFMCSYDSETEIYKSGDRKARKVHLTDEEYLTVCGYLDELNILSYEKESYDYRLPEMKSVTYSTSRLRVKTAEYDKTVSFINNADLYSHGNEAGIKLSNAWSDIYYVVEEAYIATFTSFNEDVERTIKSADDIKSFSISWGYNLDGFFGTYDSKTHRVSKSTMSADESKYRKKLVLPDETVSEILDALVKLDIEVYPDYGFVPFENGGTNEYIFDAKPKSDYDSLFEITVRTGKGEKTVRCLAPGISHDGKDEYGQKFLDTFFLIRDSIISTKEWVSVPKAE